MQEHRGKNTENKNCIKCNKYIKYKIKQFRENKHKQIQIAKNFKTVEKKFFRNTERKNIN